jgi:hypothetical protein
MEDTTKIFSIIKMGDVMFFKKSTVKTTLTSAAFTALLFATAACLSVPASALPLGAGAGQIGTAVAGAQPLLVEVQLQNALPPGKGGKGGGAAKGGGGAPKGGVAAVGRGGNHGGGAVNRGGGGNRGGRGGNNVGLGVAAGVLGVVGGLIAADQQRQYEEREVYQPREVYRECEGRRSFDPRTGTYVDYQGRVRRCR